MQYARLLALFCVWSGLSNPGWAVESRTLPAPHAKAGVTCHDCHQSEAPAGAAPESACMDCHGDLPAMAAQTRDLAVNPHAVRKAPHPGPFACTECHRQHRPPVVKCLECHPKFTFNVK
jgi:hypothetical protein